MFIYNYHTLETANVIYGYLVDYITSNFHSPSFQEIRLFSGLKSNTSVNNYLTILSDLGYISISNSSSRCITLLHFYVFINDSFDLNSFHLDDLDKKLFIFIQDFFIKHMYAPSYDDILLTGLLHSKSSISIHLRYLQQQGLISFSSTNTSRSIILNNCSILPYDN